MITHYDLFAGIGGFSIALEEVFPDDTIRHIFCEWEQFPTSVLRRHWPDGEFWGDIAELVTHTNPKHQGLEGSGNQRQGHTGQFSGEGSDQAPNWTIVTGGFPCQPFSAAGRRKGTADDRYQWPNMFEVIRQVKPEWVIAENVRGLVTWNEGLVLETVCADLESEGYEVQPFIIPAVAVGAPHRRDRVWIIANRNNSRSRTPEHDTDTNGQESDTRRQKQSQRRTSGQGADAQESPEHQNAQNPISKRSRGRSQDSGQILGSESPEVQDPRPSWPNWNRNWQEVAFATCDDSVDDGLSRLVDGVPMSRSKWRQNSLKAYGNGIVPQVAIEIMKAIKETHDRAEVA